MQITSLRLVESALFGFDMSQPKLLDQMRHKMRLHQYSPDTERAYIYWARRFILFHKKSHPKEMGKKEVEAFLTHLAVIRGVAPSTQNLALSSSFSINLCHADTVMLTVCNV